MFKLVPHVKICCLCQTAEWIEEHREESGFLFISFLEDFLRENLVKRAKFFQHMQNFYSSVFGINSNFFSQKCSNQLFELVIVFLEVFLTIWSEYCILIHLLIHFSSFISLPFKFSSSFSIFPPLRGSWVVEVKITFWLSLKWIFCSSFCWRNMSKFDQIFACFCLFIRFLPICADLSSRCGLYVQFLVPSCSKGCATMWWHLKAGHSTSQ